MLSRVLTLPCLVAVSLIGLAGPAMAKPPSGPSAATSYSVNCAADASCEHAEQADGASRNTATSVRFARSPATSTDEFIDSLGAFTQSVQVPKGSTSAEITVTWHVDAAHAATSGSHGTVFAGNLLRASIGCGTGCSTSAAQVQVAIACRANGVDNCVDPTTDLSNISNRDYTLTVKATGLSSTNLTLRTSADSYYGGQGTCLPTPSGGITPPLTSNCDYPIDATHDGLGAADLAGHLSTVTVQAS